MKKMGVVVLLAVDRAPNTEIDKIMYRGLLRYIKTLILSDWDFPILVSGLEGSGKSALALNLARDLDKRITAENLHEHVVWDGKVFVEQLYKLPPGSVLVDDEAGLDLFSRESMYKANVRLVKVVMLCRERNIIPILVIPNVWWMDNYMIHHRAQLWIQVEFSEMRGGRRRGLAVVHKPIRNRYKKYTYFKPVFTFNFPDFPSDLKEKYLSLKRENSRARAFESGADEFDWKQERNRIALALYERGWKQGEIAELLGLSQPMVHYIIKKQREELGVNV